MVNALQSRTEAHNQESVGRWSIVSYGAGHMLNDITSSCWFTYLLLFLTDIGLSPREAALVMLSGQIADAFTTIFAGELIDRFGHFKLWHAGGSIVVAISFSSVFGGCLPCKILGTNSSTLQTIGYSTFAAIFNVGWAVTQVSHMSMVTCITLNSTSRVALTSCRNAFSMYRWIAHVSIFMGCCFLGVFFIGTKEPELKQQIHGTKSSRISWVHWFKKELYYQVALIYMLTRLVTNVSQALLVFYVINDLGMSPSSKALVPALIYISSFTVSVILQEIRWTGWRLKVFFTAGAILWMFSGAGIFILPSKMHNLMYILSIFVGVANALMMVTCVSMQSILVGRDLNGCAFVYGSLSFVDKLSCGLALYALESYQGTTSVACCHGFRNYLSIARFGTGLIPATCAFLSVAITYTMELHDDTGSETLVEPLLV